MRLRPSGGCSAASSRVVGGQIQAAGSSSAARSSVAAISGSAATISGRQSKAGLDLAGQCGEVEQALAGAGQGRLVHAQQAAVGADRRAAGRPLQQGRHVVDEHQAGPRGSVRIEPTHPSVREQRPQRRRHALGGGRGGAAQRQQAGPVTGGGGRLQQRRQAPTVGTAQARVGRDHEIER